MTVGAAARCPRCFGETGPGAPCLRCGGRGGAQATPLALPPGTRLAVQFVVGRVLGSPGGFGITYLAWDERLERRVAIKEFFPRDLAGRDADYLTVVPHTGGDRMAFAFGREQFLGEARTLARFDHPNIVRVRTFFEANDTAYLVMDYYEGQSLEAFLQGRPGGKLPEELAVRVLMPVLDGLRAVHAENVLHRDIKPHNIYLTEHRRVLLLDFGAARQAIGERSRGLTEIYTHGYAPFEQYSRHGKQGPWTDVYACAATLYRMVTGEVPPDAPGRAMEDTLMPARALEPSVSERLSQVLAHALAVRPEERPQSAEAFQRMLVGEPAGGQVVVEEDIKVRAGEPDAPVQQTISSTRQGNGLPWIIGGLLFVIVAILLWAGGSESSSALDTWDIPSLRATVEDVRLFETPYELLPVDDRRYTIAFRHENTRYIGVELRLRHPAPGDYVEAPATCTYYASDGTMRGRPMELRFQVQPDSIVSLAAHGWGAESPGTWWAPGTYRVECSAEGRVIAERTFLVF